MKNIYITWHYTTHGVAYLKHILSKFYLIGRLPTEIGLERIEQEDMNTTFDHPFEGGFLFDEIIYLTAPQATFDNLSSRRSSYKKNILHDKAISKIGLKEVFEEIIQDDDMCYDLEKELQYVEKKYPVKFEQFKQSVWRNIQHYPIAEQIKWLTLYSNFKNVYKDKIKVIELNVMDLRNEKQISNEVSRWAQQYFSKQKNCQKIINVSLGSNETQVVWHILAEAGQLPTETRFIKTNDDKTDKKEERFKPFSIQEIPTNLISSIGEKFAVFNDTKSPSRAVVNMKMKAFLKTGFSILLIGERGIGKSRIASAAKESQKGFPFVEANCASFSDDNVAMSEFFGYEPGTFTDGLKGGKKGLLEEADRGILFLDEIHHLKPLVQAKLMKALQTDQNNMMRIRKLGSNKEILIECCLIFATNKTIAELRGDLLPDFYDRIVQHVVNIPPIRETVEDRITDWGLAWEGLRLKGDVPNELELLSWLKKLPLYGNYRDLQKIAMYYDAFNQFDDETKKMLTETSAFQYAKNEFEKYHSPVVELKNEKFNFNIHQTTKQMIAEYRFQLQYWAVSKFGGRKAAVDHFKSKGDTVTEKTFNDWRTKRPNKKNNKPSV